MKKKISLLIYYILANRLPPSIFPLGRFYNSFRIKLAKKFLTIGENCKIQPRVNFGDGNKIIIGDYCVINEYVYIQQAIIGNYVMISPNVVIYANFHIFDRTDIPMVFQGRTVEQPCIIEDDVWIGKNVVIMPALRIGKGSIIGAGAVVTKNVAPYSIVGGVPARFIRSRLNDINGNKLQLPLT